MTCRDHRRRAANAAAVASLMALVWAMPASAAPWVFGEPVTVAGAAEGVYYHLEASGRRSLAASGDVVAVVWEDNRSGSPQAYVSLKGGRDAAFGRPRLLSSGAEAYEPTVAALGDGAFLAAWEQDGAVWARRVGGGADDPAQRIGGKPSRQVSTAPAGPGSVLLAWVEGEERNGRVRVARWDVRDGLSGIVGPVPPVDATGPGGQLYPALAAVGDGAAVAWEDRRLGHTVIMTARSNDLRQFSPSAVLNDVAPSMSAEFGRGTGAARPAVCADAQGRVAAVWADKRDFRSGYDVYAALGTVPGGDFAADDERVQDDFGAGISQWHPAVACGDDGMRVAAWDDDRDESADVWISWRNGASWSDDLAVPGASGPGQQGYPALTLDEAGRLHLAWVEQKDGEGPNRLRYLVASPVAN
jgi:hypothetical protein